MKEGYTHSSFWRGSYSIINFPHNFSPECMKVCKNECFCDCKQVATENYFSDPKINCCISFFHENVVWVNCPTYLWPHKRGGFHRQRLARVLNCCYVGGLVKGSFWNIYITKKKNSFFCLDDTKRGASWLHFTSSCCEIWWTLSWVKTISIGHVRLQCSSSLFVYGNAIS